MLMTLAADRDGVAAAHEQIRPYIRRTPTLLLDGITAKLELCQHAGSFKTRGAFANVLMRDVPPAGVVAATGGNHGASVSYAARAVGRVAKIFAPAYSSPAKLQRIRDYGGNLTLVPGLAEGFAAQDAWAAETGAIVVHSFDQLETMLGAGTVALELEEQAPGLDTVLVPVGGAGFIAGVGAWYQGSVRVIGVEPELSPTLYNALEAGHPVDTQTGVGIAADATSPPRVGALAFPVARQWVDRVVLVTDDAIRRAQGHLWSHARIVAEPAGACTMAAILSGVYTPAPTERVGIIISGGNTVAVDFTR
ncbi:MAG TPA: threonine/serine dehydratase [Gemmatimonadaceae bacterium]|jgi:threonine dehydratase|nr:threonine/serine dehydratase [Gemmatimonadaceae bacterium]